MKCHETDSDLAAEVTVKCGDNPSEEYGFWKDEDDDSLCCWIPVVEGETISIHTSLKGFFSKGHVDLAIDGIFRNTKESYTKKTRTKRVEHFDTVYHKEGRTVKKSLMRIKALEETSTPSGNQDVGIIEVLLHAIQADDQATSLNVVDTFSEMGNWREGNKRPGVHALVPDFEIEMIDSDEPVIKSGAAHRIVSLMKRKRPGSSPWAIMKFFYRSKGKLFPARNAQSVTLLHSDSVANLYPAAIVAKKISSAPKSSHALPQRPRNGTNTSALSQFSREASSSIADSLASPSPRHPLPSRATTVDSFTEKSANPSEPTYTPRSSPQRLLCPAPSSDGNTLPKDEGIRADPPAFKLPGLTLHTTMDRKSITDTTLKTVPEELEQQPEEFHMQLKAVTKEDQSEINTRANNEVTATDHASTVPESVFSRLARSSSEGRKLHIQMNESSQVNADDGTHALHQGIPRSSPTLDGSELAEKRQNDCSIPEETARLDSPFVPIVESVENSREVRVITTDDEIAEKKVAVKGDTEVDMESSATDDLVSKDKNVIKTSERVHTDSEQLEEELLKGDGIPSSSNKRTATSTPSCSKDGKRQKLDTGTDTAKMSVTQLQQLLTQKKRKRAEVQLRVQEGQRKKREANERLQTALRKQLEDVERETEDLENLAMDDEEACLQDEQALKDLEN
ncbi:uncharacterized protein K452DRAFT_333446 [Aplosporella prunicola CBS 121167]|uniref:Uncharacterized protein n=1 Tax=Aplosporella prunicola CBS 121167 TaxID=1176127 RepID=A0A6A6BDX5_9PEZI|nr:uncharacterized protein K452DRAFT_333446 [Aplosporella prunicola CBS 121167]KAF2141708.1 hypothetical protein K452DRAFT_333446 [Aplosporella prunicola CBS 121167]